MAKSVQELIQSRYPDLLTSQDSENYDNIELTEQEVAEALTQARKKKFYQLQARQAEIRAEENRLLLTQTQWSTKQTRDFMIHRSLHLFEQYFKVDDHNKDIFNAFCCYFSKDEEFLNLIAPHVQNVPSLDKGILLAGGVGTGKTSMMRLFSRNQRQCFNIVAAKKISDIYADSGMTAIHLYIGNLQIPINDSNAFYQKEAGWCIDDQGAEDIKSHFGNRSNVIGDIIEAKYDNKTTGPFFHMTTNLTAKELTSYYGERVASRMREIFNIILLTGPDRRK